MRIFTPLYIAWKLEEQFWSVLGPKFLTWWLVLGWVNVCYLLRSWVNFPTISSSLFITPLLFLWLAILPCHPRFYLCACCIIFTGIHTFGSCSFCYTQASEKNQKHFVATNVLPTLKIIHVPYNNYTTNIASETFGGGEWTIPPNTIEDKWYGDKRKCIVVK